MENTETFRKVNNLLLALKRQSASGFNLGEFINKVDAPYKNNINTILVNGGFVEFVRRGVYKPKDFEVNDGTVKMIILACREATKRRNTNNPNPAEMDKKPAFKVIEKPTNPFGMDSFSTIMVEKGSIRIGEYLLEGSFTITKVKDDTASTE